MKEQEKREPCPKALGQGLIGFWKMCYERKKRGIIFWGGSKTSWAGSKLEKKRPRSF